MNNMEIALQEAISGEFNAIRKYKAYAEAARKEGFKNVEMLFKALVAGETIHLNNHKRALGTEFTPEEAKFTAGTSIENLTDALNGETWEFKEMYPGLIKKIKRPKNEDEEVTKLSFRWALDTEKHHAEVLAQALEFVTQGKDLPDARFYVCEVCGNLHMGDPPDDICPVCKHDVVFFNEVNA